MKNHYPISSAATIIRNTQATLELPHVCTEDSCPVGDSYFVSAVDGDRHFYMAGPYKTHAEALANVDISLEIANKHDSRAWFMPWGTLRIAGQTTGFVGVLNKHNLL